MASTPDLKAVISKNVRTLRKSRGLTQHELAKRAKLTTHYVNRLEREPQNLTVDSLTVIARALDVSVVQLITDPDDRPKTAKKTMDAIETVVGLLRAYPRWK